MKNITTFLGCVGVVCLILGCSSNSDDLEKIVLPQESVAEAASSSEASPPPSSATVTSSNSSNSTSTVNDSTEYPPVEVTHDTIHKEVVITSSLDSYPDPYFSSGIFCWTEECEKKWAGVSSSSAPKSSSSSTIDISMSVEAPVLPTVDGTKMTDNRDGNTYNLQTVAGKLWMAENIKYKTSAGSYCDNGGTDVCAQYGTFYSYAAAQKACPSGWRLPTPTEVVAANDNEGHDWWTVGGRFKLTSSGEIEGYGLEGDQGYLWLESDGENNAWRVEDYSEKKLEELTSATERAFNVRCVKVD